MKILILAAGYAVRLRSLTLNNPKPLLEVGKRKILDRIMDRVEQLKDVEEVYVVTNQNFFKKFEEWLKSSERGLKINLINDGSTSNDNKLGAIGDLKVFVDRVGAEGEILVIAGDNLFEFDLSNFLDFGKSKTDGVSIALHDVGDINLAKKYGVVQIDEKDKKVIGFEEKPQEPKSTLISTCIYYFPKGKLGLINEYAKSSSEMDEPGNYIGWLKDKDRVYGFVFKEKWFDIGGTESYEKANEEYAGR